MSSATRLRVVHPGRRDRRGVLVVVCARLHPRSPEAALEALHVALPGAHVLVVRCGEPPSEPPPHPHVPFGVLSVLDLPSGLPISAAYHEGFTWGLARGYEVVCALDPDDAQGPSDVTRLVRPVLEGIAELVIGSRFVMGSVVRGAPRAALARIRWANALANGLLGLGVIDATSGFRAYAASLLEALPLASLGSEAPAYHLEMTQLARAAGAYVLEVPVEMTAQGDAPAVPGSETYARIATLGWARLRHRDGTAPNAVAPAFGASCRLSPAAVFFGNGRSRDGEHAVRE